MQPLAPCFTSYTDAVLSFSNRDTNDETVRLSPKATRYFKEYVRQFEELHAVNGLDFSRIQLEHIVNDVKNGAIIEFETLGPYLSSYVEHKGSIALQNLTDEDRIGLELATVFRELFPTARLVSLYDDHNLNLPGNRLREESLDTFTDIMKVRFRTSLEALFRQKGVIQRDACEGINYFLLSESQRLADVETLVAKLEEKGCIIRKDNEVIFRNDQATNPLHQQFHLRSKKGKWLCETLDAAAFLPEPNLDITHIVVLPAYMRTQQDRVWEILKVLGFPWQKYHNIFFDPAVDPQVATQAVRDTFSSLASL